MSRLAAKSNHTKVVFQQWRFKQEIKLEHQKQELQEEKRELERARRAFEREKKEYTLWQKSEDGRLQSENKLFQMKWKILEEELKKLADEKQQVEKQRNFYRYVEEHEKKNQIPIAKCEGMGEMFFVGVGSEPALKRRYKDLIKIYHPDNLDGDTGTLQEINREYDRLKAIYQ